MGRGILEDEHGEGLLQKPIWAEMQQLEYGQRSNKTIDPILLKGAIAKGKYDALGMPSDDRNWPHVWILLNTHFVSKGVYITIPNDHLTISCLYLESLAQQTKIDPIVWQYLQTRCIK